MLKFRILSSAIVLLTTLAGAGAQTKCANSTLLQNDANKTLEFLNDLRTSVLKGEQKNGHNGKYWPAAMSMPPLEWNCTLETEAQKYLSDNCNNNLQQKPDGYTIYFGDYYDINIPLMLYHTTSKADFTEQNLDNVINVTYNGSLKEFSNLVRSSTTTIGCSRLKCKNENLMACITNQAELKNGEVIYEAANVSSACPTNPYMTDNIRSAFLNKHNTLRVTLALGVVDNGQSRQKFGQAKNMPTLVYDCELEKAAYEKAKQCENYTIESDKENFFSYNTNIDRDLKRVATQAPQKWWSEFRKSQGISDPNNLYASNLNSDSFAKIASDLTSKIGCAVVKCTGMVNVVCRYETKVGDGQRLYGPGTKCEKCEGNCVNGLCPAAEIGAKV